MEISISIVSERERCGTDSMKEFHDATGPPTTASSKWRTSSKSEIRKFNRFHGSATSCMLHIAEISDKCRSQFSYDWGQLNSLRSNLGIGLKYSAGCRFRSSEEGVFNGAKGSGRNGWFLSGWVR